jgi:uroporphyrinogen-III synthase
MPGADDTSGALNGCTVVVTRETRGELGRRLDALGATVVHVPLIEVTDPDPADSEALRVALGGPLDWLVVTSAAGADRVAAIADRPRVRLAAVGTATARRLAEVAGRPVDLIPQRQLAGSLVEEFALIQRNPSRVLVAQADRAANTLEVGLTDAGHRVDVVTAYRTVARRPSPRELSAVAGADAVAFASGSAAIAWSQALGADAMAALPPIVAAIGPTTAAAAVDAGLKITHESSEHSLDGLVQILARAWSQHHHW